MRRRAGLADSVLGGRSAAGNQGRVRDRAQPPVLRVSPISRQSPTCSGLRKLPNALARSAAKSAAPAGRGGGNQLWRVHDLSQSQVQVGFLPVVLRRRGQLNAQPLPHTQSVVLLSFLRYAVADDAHNRDSGVRRLLSSEGGGSSIFHNGRCYCGSG